MGRLVALVAVVVVAGFPTSAGAAPAAPPSTLPEASTRPGTGPTTYASPVLGPNPSWVRNDGRGSTRARSAVGPEGYTYLTSREVLFSSWSPEGIQSSMTTRTGDGTFSGASPLDPPDITVIPETPSGPGSIVITGQIEGRVTFREGQIGELTLDGGSGSSFVMQLQVDGMIRWARLFGDGATVSASVEHSSGTIVVAGMLNDSATLDALPTTAAGDGDAFLAGFDPDTGAARWITELERLPTSDADIVATDLAADEDSVVWLGRGDRGVTADGAGHQIDGTCAPAATCDVLVEIDPTDGRPLLAQGVSGDQVSTTAVDLTEDGFAVLGQDRSLPDPPNAPTTFVAGLDSAGSRRWTRDLQGAVVLDAGADLVVDANGDVIVVVTAPGEIVLGGGPGAPTLAGGDGAIALIEYDEDGGLKRYVPGTGFSTEEPPTITLGVDATDTVHLVGDQSWPGPATIGSGPGAISVDGTGPLIATFLPDVSPPATFSPTDPIRVLDSRTSTGGWGAKLTAGAPRRLRLPDISLPAEITAVVLNLTVTDVSAMTYVTAWPAGTPQPTVSNLNVVAGDTISNQVTVRLGDAREISLATAQGSTHVVADLMGYYAVTDWGFHHHSLAPARLLDSRTTTGGWAGTLTAGNPRLLTVAGTKGIPADAVAVVLSVTATDTTDQTFLRVEPSGAGSTSSNLNINAGQTITNLATVRVGDDAKLQFTNAVGAVHVVVDAVGWFDDDPDGSRFRPISPTRVLDSRTGTGGYTTRWSAGTIRTVPVAGLAVEGDTVTAIAANLTATDTTAMSFLTLYPAAPRPSTSNLLFTAGQTIASAAETGVAPNGTVSLFNQLGSAHLVLDVAGYYVDPPTP